MKKAVDTKKLTEKDLMVVGIFTAVYLIIYIMTSCILGVIPIVSLTMTFLAAFF